MLLSTTWNLAPVLCLVNFRMWWILLECVRSHCFWSRCNIVFPGFDVIYVLHAMTFSKRNLSHRKKLSQVQGAQRIVSIWNYRIHCQTSTYPLHNSEYTTRFRETIVSWLYSVSSALLTNPISSSRRRVEEEGCELPAEGERAPSMLITQIR